ncbi:hypothetical protein [Pareuzebyella sediminis]|uniref:hypothetical protein n=1 Tax=Pareuzebyella sediminis TaxID=2607998 RepID=UPI0011ED1D54|nr:hypothetical protein [Pareuzebyella sediminis]
MKNSPLPNWCAPTLQGLAYWLAYKKEFYNDYKLSEGAIVGELAQGINSNIDNHNEVLECERMYKELSPCIKGQTRLDLAIGRKSKGTRGKSLNIETLKYALEVKRYENGWNLILEDLNKLKELHSQNKLIRCFLIVASQNYRPVKLVSDKNHPIEKFLKSELNFETKVRTVKKAFSSKRKSDYGNFAILIELA